MLIHQYLEKAAADCPDHLAVKITTGEELSYRELEQLSSQVAEELKKLGIRSGDRVGIFMRKSLPAVVSIYGALKADATYVPIDTRSPLKYNAGFMKECLLSMILVDEFAAAQLAPEAREIGVSLIETITLDGSPVSVFKFNAAIKSDQSLDEKSSDERIAVLLQTSGSTGKNKIVEHTHQNCVSFIEWYSKILRANQADRIGCHVPFNFAASIFDLFFPAKHMAALILIDEHTSQNPAWLPSTIEENQITIFKSPAAVLSLTAQFANLNLTAPGLRYLILGGGLFPAKHLEKLRFIFKNARIFNSYSGSESLAIMAYEVRESTALNIPVGKEHFAAKVKVMNESGAEVIDIPGELWVSGPQVMKEYWNAPDRNERSFHDDPDGQRWYKTGDMMLKKSTGEIYFVGRKDRMVKRRGYRIGLEEVEAHVLAHPQIAEAAAVAPIDEVSGCKILVYYKIKKDTALSALDLREFLVRTMPPQMLPDTMTELPELPRTASGKIDLDSLTIRH